MSPDVTDGELIAWLRGMATPGWEDLNENHRRAKLAADRLETLRKALEPFAREGAKLRGCNPSATVSSISVELWQHAAQALTTRAESGKGP